MDKGIIENRLVNFRKRLGEKGMDTALITKRENYIYLSGFTGTSAFLIITQKEAILLTDFRYKQQAAVQAPAYKIIQYQGSLIAALSTVMKELGTTVLGFEDRAVTFNTYTEYKAHLGVSELAPLGDTLDMLRMIKDFFEIEKISKAVEVADDAFSHILGFIKPGVTETEIAAELEYFMKRKGATGPSFDFIVASGTRSSMPHGVASGKAIEKGDPVTMDIGALYEGYCSDMTRTVFVGSPTDEMRKIYNIVLEAQLRATEGAVKGAIGKDVDAIARKIISDNGYGNNFGHGLGHGVGLEIHEEPRFSPTGNFAMEDNVVITVEPGIYVDGVGGVRIEDMIVISGNKPKVLTRSSKELIIL